MSISPFELLRYCYWISLDIISYYAIAIIGASPTRLIARLRCAALRCAALRNMRLCAALHSALRCAALHAALRCAAANRIARYLYNSGRPLVLRTCELLRGAAGGAPLAHVRLDFTG